MANKYSNFQFQPYVSTFVDPKSTEINTILRNRWEKNRSNYDLMSTSLASEQVGPGDQWIKDSAMQDVNNRFEEAIRRNNWEDHTATVSDATNAWLSNEGMNLAKQSWKVHEEEEKMKSKIRMEKGPNAILFDWEFAKDPNAEDGYARDNNGNLIRQNKFENHRSFYTDDETGETVRNPYRMTSEMMGDWNTAQSSMITNIQSDPLWGGRVMSALRVIDPSGTSGVTQQDVATYMQSGYLMSGSGVSAEKVAVISQALAQAYSTSSPEGQQQMRALMEQRVNSETGLPFTQQEALAKMAGQIGTEGKYFSDQMLLKAYENQPTFGATTNPFNNIIKDKRVFPASNKEDALDFMFTEKGSTPGSVEFKNNKLKSFDAAGNYIFPDQTEGMDRDTYINALQQQLRDDLASTQADPNMTDEEKLEQNNRKYIKKHEDWYVAYLLDEYSDLRQAYKNDKDFIQAIYSGRRSAKSYVGDLYGVNMPLNFNLAAEQTAGLMTKTTAAFRTHEGEVVTGVIGSGTSPGLPSDAGNIINAMANHYAKREKGQWTGLNAFGSSTPRGEKGTTGNNSGVGFKETRSLINAALQSPDNWSIYAMNPGGVAGKTDATWVVKVNVPSGKDMGMSKSNPFSMEFEMEMPQNMQVFNLSGNLFKDIMNTKLNEQREEYMGQTTLEDGQQAVMVGTTSIVAGDPQNPNAGLQPLLRVQYFKPEDIDPNTGLPIRDNGGNLMVQPLLIRNERVMDEGSNNEAYEGSQYTNQVYGKDVIEVIRQGEINALKYAAPEFYMTKYTKSTGEQKYPTE